MFSIKICGVTTSDDALMAAKAGADAIGMVCYADSPRCVDVVTAGNIGDSLPSQVTLVMLFVDAPTKVVAEYCTRLPRAWLQFHGTEDAQYCNFFNRPYLIACQPSQQDDFARVVVAHPRAKAVICDGGGGQGKSFNWELLPVAEQRKLPIVLAGGLNPDNVATAIDYVRPIAVDVSSGVCVRGNPLRKDSVLLTNFISSAKKTILDSLIHA